MLCAQWSHPKRESLRKTQIEQMNTEHTRRKKNFQHGHKNKQKRNTLTKQGTTNWDESVERDVPDSESARNEELCFGPLSKSRTIFLSVFWVR